MRFFRRIRRVSHFVHTASLSNHLTEVLDDLNDHPYSLNYLEDNLEENLPPVRFRGVRVLVGSAVCWGGPE